VVDLQLIMLLIGEDSCEFGRPIIGTVNVTVKLLYVLFIPLRFGCYRFAGISGLNSDTKLFAYPIISCACMVPETATIGVLSYYLSTYLKGVLSRAGRRQRSEDPDLTENIKDTRCKRPSLFVIQRSDDM